MAINRAKIIALAFLWLCLGATARPELEVTQEDEEDDCDLALASAEDQPSTIEALIEQLCSWQEDYGKRSSVACLVIFSAFLSYKHITTEPEPVARVIPTFVIDPDLPILSRPIDYAARGRRIKNHSVTHVQQGLAFASPESQAELLGQAQQVRAQINEGKEDCQPRIQELQIHASDLAQRGIIQEANATGLELERIGATELPAMVAQEFARTQEAVKAMVNQVNRLLPQIISLKTEVNFSTVQDQEQFFKALEDGQVEAAVNLLRAKGTKTKNIYSPQEADKKFLEAIEKKGLEKAFTEARAEEQKQRLVEDTIAMLLIELRITAQPCIAQSQLQTTCEDPAINANLTRVRELALQAGMLYDRILVAVQATS